MRFCWTTLSVKNMDESLKFYQEIVGLTVVKRFNAGEGSEIAFLGDDDTKLELISNENKKEVDIGKDISVGFEVKFLEEKMTYVKAKGLEVSGPFSPNPSVEFFFISDPNGLRVQFVENK